MPLTSGYVANDAALSTLARELPGMAVLSDAFNHASMIAGIRNSRAEKHVFRHNDPEDLARLLDRVAANRPKLVCFESVGRPAERRALFAQSRRRPASTLGWAISTAYRVTLRQSVR
jgi:hypothetical protein